MQHAVAFHFHDILAALVRDLEDVGALLTRLELPEYQYEQIEDLNGEALWDWFVDNGYEGIVYDQAYRQLTAALTADACHFLYEALVCSAKAKMAVAYSLLRKPFKENLLLLEWLCAKPDDFLEAFHGASVWEYTPNRLGKEKRLDILAGAIQRIDREPVFDEELLFRIRYSKKEPGSLEYLWTKATHLVTTVEVMETEPTNINFVFSTYSAIEEQWAYFYDVVPVLMDYMVQVAESVAGRMIDWETDRRDMQQMLRTLALYRSIEESSNQINVVHFVDELLESMNEAGGLECERCSSVIPVDRLNADRLWSAAELECPRCGEIHDFWRAIFAEQH